MKNVKILKKVVPLLREKEEITYIVEKSKWELIFRLCVLVLFAILWILFLIDVAINFPLDELMLFLMFSLILPYCAISSIVAYITNAVVITNQRLFCIRYGKVTCFEKEDIDSITRKTSRTFLSYVRIKAKKFIIYDIEYFSCDEIKEKLSIL